MADRHEGVAAIKHPKRPTAKQLATAADIATRFAETAVLSSEDYSAVRRAATTMGVAALAKGHRGS